MSPGSIDTLPTPALLVDLDRLEANLRRMQALCDRLGVALRPHVKTHKCIEIGRRQMGLGARGITVSTLAEARACAEAQQDQGAGFDDVTWAFPVVPSRLPEAVELARRITLRLVADGPEAIAAVEEAARRAELPLHLHLEVDCGDGRSGVDPSTAEGTARALELARSIDRSRWLVFDGLLTHSGHAYAGRQDEPDDRALAAARQEWRTVSELAARLREDGIEVPTVSVGSTPGMSALGRVIAAAELPEVTAITEARPGNYAFFDATQVAIGSCRVEDCALTVLATVVSSQPDGRAVVDAGALALSKDPGPSPGDPKGPWTGMGRVFRDHAAAELETDLRLTSLSQEHGELSGPRPWGERLRILPNHSCLTVACFDRMFAVRGDRVVDEWEIRRER